MAATAQTLIDIAEYLAGDSSNVYVFRSRSHYLGEAMDVSQENMPHGLHNHRDGWARYEYDRVE